MKSHNIIIIGLFIILVAAFMLAAANSRYSACESIPGKIVQLISKEQQRTCSIAKTLAYFSYVVIAIGAAVAVTGIIRRGD